jgi:hypothetical protein
VHDYNELTEGIESPPVGSKTGFLCVARRGDNGYVPDLSD